MKAFWAIVKLTCRSALRSHIFQLLLLLLLFCIAVIPATVSGDGTAAGFIRVALQYSLGTVSAVLSLSSIWLGCFTMTQDVENYQLHMVVSKPVSRYKIWVAKWFGVLSIHVVLLLIAALATYGTILFRINKHDFQPGEQEKIQNEVLVGRRVFLPEPINIEGFAQKHLEENIKQWEAEGTPYDNTPAGREKLLESYREMARISQTELKHGERRLWVYRNLPADLTGNVSFRYRFFIAEVDSNKQRFSDAMWLIGVPQVQEVDSQGNRPPTRFNLMPISEMPEKVLAGDFGELSIPAENISPEGSAMMGFVNLDTNQENMYFQISDGPKLLLPVTSFPANYARAIFVIVLMLMVLTALACAAGGVFSMPMAIFFVSGYLLFGIFAKMMLAAEFIDTMQETIGLYIGYAVNFFIVPVQGFQVSGLVANGELIEFSLIGSLIFYYLICRALPLILLGIWLYRRRELGLVVRK